MKLWEFDNSLTIAIDLAIAFVPVLRWFERLWPSAGTRLSITDRHVVGLTVHHEQRRNVARLARWVV